MNDAVAFLSRMLDADEQAAGECARVYPPPWDVSDRGWMATVLADEPDFRVVTELEQWDGKPEGAWLGTFLDHIARHDPARVLADVAAKRAIIALHSPHHRGACPVCWRETPRSALREDFPCRTLRLLAQAYDGHPDFDPAWRVT